MPQITEYNAPENLGLRPSETGVESTAAAARRVGGAFSEAAQLTKEAGARIGSALEVAGTQAVDHMANREISQGAAAFAGLMNAKTKQWHDTNSTADPNDPTVAQNFQSSVNADLEKFKSGFLTQRGQQWAEEHALKLQEHLFNKSTGDRATAAGHAVAINASKALNGFANAAMWDGTEKGLEAALSSWSTSGFNPKTIEEGKKEIITRAAGGYIEQNAEVPDWAHKTEYSQYLDAKAMAAMKRAAEHQRTQDRVLEHAQQAETKQQNKQAVNDAVDANRTDNMRFNPDTNSYEIKPEFFRQADKIRQMPEGEKIGQALMDWGQRQQSRKPPPVKSDSAVHTDLLERMITPTNNPTTEAEIRTAAAEDHLSPADTNKLINLHNALTKAPMRDPVMAATLNAVKPLLGNDTVGKENYSAFLQNFIPQYLQLPQAERAGALDFKNPNSFINKVMSDYQRTPQQKMEQHINDKLGITPTPEAPTPSPVTPVSVKTQKEAQDLKPGTPYVTPNGDRYIR